MKCISLFLCICLIIVSVVGCSGSSADNTSENTLDTIQTGNKTDEVTSYYDKNIIHRPSLHKEEIWYSILNNSFAKVKIAKMYNDIYFSIGDDDFSEPFFLVDFEIIEDYYEKTAEKTVFTAIIPLYYNNDETINAMKKLIESSDYLYCFFDIEGGEGAMDATFLNYSKREGEESKKYENFDLYTDYIRLWHLELIPVVNGKVNLSLLTDVIFSMEDENIESFYVYGLQELIKFLYNGMPYEEFETNIKELYQKLQ